MNETNEMWRSVRADKQQRNAAQKRDAMARFDEIARWCFSKQIAMDVKNDGEHWKFRHLIGTVVNWWPGTGKAQVDCKDGKANKAQPAGTWDDVRGMIEKLREGSEA